VSVTLDGHTLFDDQGLTIETAGPSRTSLERGAVGLDGTLSIDLGKQVATLRQTGLLRATSRSAMQTRIALIKAFIDGQTHTLVTPDGRVHNHLRMDTFRQLAERVGGPGIVVDYEIVYTQLGS